MLMVCVMLQREDVAHFMSMLIVTIPPPRVSVLSAWPQNFLNVEETGISDYVNIYIYIMYS